MAEVVQRVAANVRRVRLAVGISQSELARRAGVSKAAVSQIEGGRSSPTVETVWALAEALGCPFSSLTVEAGGIEVAVVRRDEGLWVHGRVISSRLLHRQVGAGAVEVHDVLLHPGGVHESEAHTAGLVEQLVLHAGAARIGPAVAPVELAAGDSAAFAADAPHVYEAIGGEARGLLVMHYPSFATGRGAVTRPESPPPRAG